MSGTTTGLLAAIGISMDDVVAQLRFVMSRYPTMRTRLLVDGDEARQHVSPRRFPAQSQQPSPRYWQGQLTAPAMRLAVRAIAARTGVETQSVLLTLFAVSLARVTGINPVVTQVTAGNRFRPGLSRTVSPVMQGGLLVLDFGGGTVDEEVVRTRRRSMVAYKNAYCDPDRRDELVARVTEERGDGLDIDCTFNDWWPPTEAGPPPDPAEIQAVRHEGGFRWHYKQDEVRYSHLFVNVDNVPGTLQMTVTADCHVISPDAVAGCLREMSDTAIAAAIDPATPTGAPDR